MKNVSASTWPQAVLAKRRQVGATLIEYVLIVAVIAIAVFAAGNLGVASAISGVFTKASTTIGGDGQGGSTGGSTSDGT